MMGLDLRTEPHAADRQDDAHLLAAARTGSTVAIAHLYTRHIESAKRLARRLSRTVEADDVVSDAFERILRAMRRGDGPESAFRSYLLTTVRRQVILSAGKAAREIPDGHWDDRPTAAGGRGMDGTYGEREIVRRVLRQLPPRWGAVLWLLEVEGLKPQEAAPLLNAGPNAVSALAKRAREGFRQAYLAEHLGADITAACRPYARILPSYVRRTATPTAVRSVQAHTGDCAECCRRLSRLRDVDRWLRQRVARQQAA